jgi:hypothetical protein
VTIERQDRKEFKRLLDEVMKTDLDKNLDYRLVNVLAQRRAKWLLSRIDDLFVE